MERITVKNPDGTIGIGDQLKYYNYQDIACVLKRLSEYEDTGLTPEQIDLIGKFLKQIMDKAECETYDELIELIKDGRFFVISKGIKDYMVESGMWNFEPK